ncbi:unnamed protein product [Pleuronectes platessa]|uniref:Uncharacterized protein n=1 Tax=Pleuronectes platessa TaxID=8262 RepID=A0A9N7UZC6_PLEPL|nr:unnamed protein product [Pleuronectes platessa]
MKEGGVAQVQVCQKLQEVNTQAATQAAKSPASTTASRFHGKNTQTPLHSLPSPTVQQAHRALSQVARVYTRVLTCTDARSSLSSSATFVPPKHPPSSSSSSSSSHLDHVSQQVGCWEECRPCGVDILPASSLLGALHCRHSLWQWLPWLWAECWKC